SAFRMNVRAGSRPPISSTTTTMLGSRMMSSTDLKTPRRLRAWRSRPSRRVSVSRSAIAASSSRQPARSSRVSRWLSRSLTTPPPTVPSPSRPRRTDCTASAVEDLEAAERLTDPLLVLDEGEANVAFAVLAEADPRRHRDLRLLDAELGELERAERAVLRRDRRPDEHRPLGLLDLPADLVQAVHQHVPSLAMHVDDVGDDGLIALECDDAGDLDGLERAVVEVRLDACQRVDHARVGVHEAPAPPRHAVRL